tara:strand:- start:16414 stop:16653 length:240 start_codon:yes stop_codon:yes gene_type:complete
MRWGKWIGAILEQISDFVFSYKIWLGLAAIQAVLAVAKVFGVISWSWWFVLIPFWASIGVGIWALLLLLVIMVGLNNMK